VITRYAGVKAINLTAPIGAKEKVMITLKTDYSPELAAEEQENDNLVMIQMLLVMAGLSQKELMDYNHETNMAANLYTDERGSNPGPDDWEHAKAAAEPRMAQASKILADAGITIENVLTKSLVEGYFSHITTAVYNDYGNMEMIACIERAVTDLEAETYEDNKTGYGANND